jgi:hypothetical protein
MCILHTLESPAYLLAVFFVCCPTAAAQAVLPLRSQTTQPSCRISLPSGRSSWPHPPTPVLSRASLRCAVLLERLLTLLKGLCAACCASSLAANCCGLSEYAQRAAPPCVTYKLHSSPWSSPALDHTSSILILPPDVSSSLFCPAACGPTFLPLQQMKELSPSATGEGP